MSINVTVSGNPVRINRGKMVTSHDSTKSEFEKRRLMRLEQVRQQSKDIAENVRNRFKKEKSKCLSEIEKDGETKLKNWQARRLLELQDQYQEALDELGLGHKNANQVQDEEETLLELQESNEKNAKERGRVAAELMQVEKNEQNLKNAKPRQRKIVTSDMENSRANEVVSTGKTKKSKHIVKKAKKKKSFDSDGENKVPKLVLDPGSENSSSSGSDENTRKRTAVLRTSKAQQTSNRVSPEQQTCDISFQVPTHDKAAQTHELSTSNDFSIDNRISERIKMRSRLNQYNDCCTCIEQPKELLCTCCRQFLKSIDEKGLEFQAQNQFQRESQPQNRYVRDLQPQDRFGTEPEPQEKFEGDSHTRSRFERSSQPQSRIEEDTQTQSHFERSSQPQSRIEGDSQPQSRFGRSSQPQSQFEEHTQPQRQFSGDSHPQTAPGGEKRQSQDQNRIRRESRSTEPRNQHANISEYREDDPQNIARKSSLADKSVKNGKNKTSFTVPTSQKLKGTERKTAPTYPQNQRVAPPQKSVPTKPKITLRPTKDRPVYIGTDPQPVQYYDHPNRFSKTYQPTSSHVEQIDDEELVISPNLSEGELREKMRQREIEAHRRGQLALEKERSQREYRDLMKKLPALQKQERICEIFSDKEKYHMARDRLEELERKRQNRLDNAYEELFVRKQPAIVTLPKRTEEKEETHSVNLANWDVDFSQDETRSEKLAHMLTSLKSQKESLLKEIENTLSTGGLVTKSSSDGNVKSKSTDYTRVTRKRSRDDRPSSPTSADADIEDLTETTKTKKSSSPTPRKKAKKSKKTLILQNTSTQTTPKTAVQSAATSPIVTTKEINIDSCSCAQKDDVCEIVIKINEDEKPEVKVNPVSGKNVKIFKDSIQPSKTESRKSSSWESKQPPESTKKSTSWREQLTTSQSSTSTSYFDLPVKGNKVKKTVKPAETETYKSISSSISSSSPGGRQLDPRLVTYIKKLLNMSRTHVDQLTVSTGSEVSTPSHSVIDTPSNNPLNQLMNVMKYFNIDMADLQTQLSYTSDESTKHQNTKDSLTVSSRSSTGDNSQFTSHTETVSVKKSDDESTKKLQQYADIAASCTKKINDLTAMIEKVRQEKKQMLESSSEKETTTSYKDLPDEKSEPQKGDVNKLLEIDYGYAEKLKQLSKEEIQSEKTGREESDDELLERLKRLMEDRSKQKGTVVQMTEKKVVQEDDGVGMTSQKKVVESHKDGKTVGTATELTSVFVKPNEKKDEPPLFLDIPKLPRLEVSVDKKKKRPPPSKGLRAIAVPPHELSTIVEADSQISTKAESPTKSKTSKSADMPDILAEVKSSSDDVSENDTMETMLISLGMEWAIPTMKKTRETLEMQSSSSGSGPKESGELSLREFLSKISNLSGEGETSSSVSDQGMSLIQVDNRRTSTPIIEVGDKKDGPIFLTDSDVSSVREKSKESEKAFYVDENAMLFRKEESKSQKEGSISKSKGSTS